MIISFNLGIKGKIDLVAQCEYFSIQQNILKRAIIPLELKTGMGEDYAHHGQTIIYCLLLMQKYQQLENINGLLYYLRKNKLLNIKFKNAEVISLLIRRNFLAKFMKNLHEYPGKVILPPMITNTYECNKCHMNQVCSLANQTVETGTKVMNSRSQIVDIEELPSFKAYGEIEELLSIPKRFYFKRWLHLIQLEEDYQKLEEKRKSAQDDTNLIEMQNEEEFRKNFLNMSVLRSLEDQNLHCISFTIAFNEKERCFSLLNKHKAGDYVIITQVKHLCTIRGTIVRLAFFKGSKKVKIEKSYIVTLEIKHRLKDVEIDREALETDEKKSSLSLWKLNKTTRNFYPLMRGNVAELVLNKEHTRLSELIIDEKAPKYNDLSEKCEKFLQSCKEKYCLNQDQYFALQKCLKSEDYSLVFGMPGTGKTLLIVLLLGAFIQRGNKVLLCTYTHTALDNILMKFCLMFPSYRDKIIRISQNALNINENIRDLHYDKTKMNSFEDIEGITINKQIFSVTCLSASSYILNLKVFDVCIIAEASQVMEPLCLGLLFKARKFILVGDHYQLYPIVKSEEASRKGLSISLFENLCNRHPKAISTLTYQYRMNKEIMSISNTLIYNSKLKFANDEVANSKLELKDVNLLGNEHRWLLNILHAEKRVVFVNIDCFTTSNEVTQQQTTDLKMIEARPAKGCTGLGTKRTFSSTGWFQNLKKLQSTQMVVEDSRDLFCDKHRPLQIEAQNLTRSTNKLTVQLAKALVACGVSPKEIAIIVPSNVEKNHLFVKLNDLMVDIFAADRSPGLSKDCVIVVLDSETTNYQENWKKLSVAFAQANKKLIIIGSMSALQSTARMKNLASLIVINGWDLGVELRAKFIEKSYTSRKFSYDSVN